MTQKKSDKHDGLDLRLVPQGLRSKLQPLMNQEPDPKITLARAREFLEELLYHLKTIAHLEIRKTDGIIEKLKSLDIIDHDIAPYFHLWWNVSCLGSHFQPDYSGTIPWGKHLSLCRQCIEICVQWYLDRYPPLEDEFKDPLRAKTQVNSLSSVEADDLQSMGSGHEIRNQLDQKLFIALTGRPWAGKTSLAAKLLLDLVGDGYAPVLVHENTLLSKLPGLTDLESTTYNSSRIASNAQSLNELISTRLLHGDSFVVFLDDPFGHRHPLRSNPFTSLPVADWIELGRMSKSLGSLKVIITSPLEFIVQGRESLNNMRAYNAIAEKNSRLLDAGNIVEIKPSMYADQQLYNIVHSAAVRYHCGWSSFPDKVTIISEEISVMNTGFDALHLFCRNVKTEDDEEFLLNATRLSESKDIITSVHAAPSDEKTVLLAALVAEALSSLHIEFTFQTQMSFASILQAFPCMNDRPEEALASITSEWITNIEPSPASSYLLPQLSHPEVRDTVYNFAVSEHREMVSQALENLTGLNPQYLGVHLARWESCHLICRMAEFARLPLYDDIYKMLNPSAQEDSRNTLYAILYNWEHLCRSCIRPAALGFLKSIKSNYKWLIRSFAWEATHLWSELDSELKKIVLDAECQRSASGELRPQINDHSSLAFIAAGLAHLQTIRLASKAGCQESEEYLEMINTLLNQMVRGKAKEFTSRRNDGIFSVPGARHEVTEICKRLRNIALKANSINESDPLYKLLESTSG